MYKEKKVNNKWTSIDEWENEDGRLHIPYEKRFSDRNYVLFGLLCDGVRSSHPFSLKERGMPITYSEEVKGDYDYWDGDGHSHSYLSIKELEELRDFINSETIEITGQKDEGALKILRESIESKKETNWDLLYPYCKWSSEEKYIDFSLDVPASFIIGDGLDRIIAMFKGHEYKDCRIVFWFDN